MRIDVHRFTSDGDATLSLVHVNGGFVCFGLEDEYRAKKVMGETRIPAGRYRMKLRTGSPMAKQYAARFPDLHQGMLEILGVPGFTDILIHCGNTDDDTAGCLLVGMGATAYRMNMSLVGSALAYRELYRRVVDDVAVAGAIIEFHDNDRKKF